MKHKFVELDGLRGVAALAVVLLHTRKLFGPALAPVLTGHAYLAVDFFLLLSGLVISHAYEERLRAPNSLGGFIRDRAIRLHPMLIIGSLLGALTFGWAVPRLTGSSQPAIYIAALGIAGAIPLPVPGFGNGFPDNAPVWSLFWELILNVAFAVLVPYLATWRLTALVAISAALTVAIAIFRLRFDVGVNFFGLVAAGPRAATSFFMGVLLLRLHRAGYFAGGSRRWWIAPVLISIFFFPAIAPVPDVALDIVAALVILPLLVLAAAGSEPLLPKVAKLGGGISYPLYTLHVPLFHFATGLAALIGIAPSLPTGTTALIATLLISYAAFRFYDVPARAWLRDRYGSREHRAAPLVPAI